MFSLADILTYNTIYCVLSQGAEDQVKIVEESIKHAKEAITLDVQDGNSWCM